MKSKQLLPAAIATLVSFVLASVLVGATLGSRTALPLAAANDPTDGNITRITAGLLEQSQFSHQRLDDELAARFLDRYLDSLDPTHLLFLQSDAQEFDVFRARLPDMTRRQSALAWRPGAMAVTPGLAASPGGYLNTGAPPRGTSENGFSFASLKRWKRLSGSRKHRRQSASALPFRRTVERFNGFVAKWPRAAARQS